jgi:NAD(P)-dependent dehydrogenase (short-subunit alcohol dehydrogenase family)
LGFGPRDALVVTGAGGRALALEVDVADESSVFEAWQRTVQEFGGIYHLINNAGPASTSPRVLEEGGGALPAMRAITHRGVVEVCTR